MWASPFLNFGGIWPSKFLNSFLNILLNCNCVKHFWTIASRPIAFRFFLFCTMSLEVPPSKDISEKMLIFVFNLIQTYVCWRAKSFLVYRGNSIKNLIHFFTMICLRVDNGDYEPPRVLAAMVTQRRPRNSRKPTRAQLEMEMEDIKHEIDTIVDGISI